MFVVAHEASALHDPSEGALDDPAAADDDEALHPGHASDDLERDVGLVLGPFDEATGISAVREDVLDEREPGAGSFQDALGAVAILNVGGMDLDGEKATVGVGQGEALNATGSREMPNALAPVDLLAGVVTFASPF